MLPGPASLIPGTPSPRSCRPSVGAVAPTPATYLHWVPRVHLFTRAVSMRLTRTLVGATGTIRIFWMRNRVAEKRQDLAGDQPVVVGGPLWVLRLSLTV